MKISYACLIYKSIDYIDFFLQQFYKFTKLEKDDEFYFVANDATTEVIDYLKNNNIPHYIHNNTEEQKKEWYINNVYRAWNKSILLAKGEYIILRKLSRAENKDYQKDVPKLRKLTILKKRQTTTVRINKAPDTPVFSYWTMNNELVIMANQDVGIQIHI